MTEHRKFSFASVKIPQGKVMRLRFNETEWKLILEAVTSYADHLALKEFPEAKELASKEYSSASNADPNSDAVKKWEGCSDRVREIYSMVQHLNLIERQLELTFKLVSASMPEYIRTKDRFIHI